MDRCADPRDPGRVTLHRLNRAEYNNTVRDLLGDATRPADDFPADDHGYGFDNNADVLSASPLLVEKYDLAATNLVTNAFPVSMQESLHTFEAEVVGGSVGAEGGDGTWNLWSNGSIDMTFTAEHDGEYVIRTVAYGGQAGPDPARMEIAIDGATAKVFDVTARRNRARDYTVRALLTTGHHSVSVAFINDYYRPMDPDPTQRDRNLYVDYTEIRGPVVEVLDRIDVELLNGDPTQVPADHHRFEDNGTLTVPLTVLRAGEYTISTIAYGEQAGPDPVRMRLGLDGQMLRVVDVTATDAAPLEHLETMQLAPGEHSFTIAFINDFEDPANNLDSNLVVDAVELHGPLDLPPPPGGARDRIILCNPRDSSVTECAQQIVSSFAAKAWRRPITDTERDALVALVQLPIDEGDDFDTGVGLAVHAILLSPSFVFRVELDQDPASATPHPLSDHELAARLSYFLWSSMPDDRLRAAADAGTLSEPAQIAAQVRRMIADPKADAMVDNFAGQWLFTRALDDVNPDYAVYPDYDEALRVAMHDETSAFFGHFMTEDRPMLDMLDADFSFINDRLAAHYGLPAVGSEEVRRVSLPADSARGGLLTQASVLTVTSFPKRTSPVKRGQWVLHELLCQPPPPPPPGVEGLIDEEEMPTGSLRERMERHRSDPTCASCHALMDPIGFGLESFDGIGAHRVVDEMGFAVDSTGELPDGRAFAGARTLSTILKEDESTARCVSRRMLTYALGRGVVAADNCNLDDIVERFDSEGGSMADLIESIALSPPFRNRRGEPEED